LNDGEFALVAGAQHVEVSHHLALCNIARAHQLIERGATRGRVVTSNDVPFHRRREVS